MFLHVQNIEPQEWTIVFKKIKCLFFYQTCTILLTIEDDFKLDD